MRKGAQEYGRTLYKAWCKALWSSMSYRKNSAQYSPETVDILQFLILKKSQFSFSLLIEICHLKKDIVIDQKQVIMNSSLNDLKTSDKIIWLHAVCLNTRLIKKLLFSSLLQNHKSETKRNTFSQPISTFQQIYWNSVALAIISQKTYFL